MTWNGDANQVVEMGDGCAFLSWHGHLESWELWKNPDELFTFSKAVNVLFIFPSACQLQQNFQNNGEELEVKIVYLKLVCHKTQ